MHRFIGHRDKRRARIGIGVNRDRRNTHPPRGLDDPASNFAAIGDEDFFEHYFNTLAQWDKGKGDSVDRIFDAPFIQQRYKRISNYQWKLSWPDDDLF